MTVYLCMALAMIWPFKYWVSYLVKKYSEDADYIEIVSLVGKHNAFLSIWAASSILWPITLFGITNRMIKKLSKEKSK